MVAEYRQFYGPKDDKPGSTPSSAAGEKQPIFLTPLSEEPNGDFTNVAKNHTDYRRPQKIKE